MLEDTDWPHPSILLACVLARQATAKFLLFSHTSHVHYMDKLSV